MAKTKSTGRTIQKTPRPGKRLGLKLSGGQNAIPGNIIVRQRGSNFHPGSGTKIGRDYTIYATKEGKVNFRKLKGRKIVEVI